MLVLPSRWPACGLTLIVVGFSNAFAEEPPTELRGYYEKRVSIIEFPLVSPEANLPPMSDIQSVLRSLRMTGIGYAGLPPSHMEEAAKTFRSQGYNAIIGGGHRYMFNDDPDAKLPTNLV